MDAVASAVVAAHGVAEAPELVDTILDVAGVRVVVVWVEARTFFGQNADREQEIRCKRDGVCGRRLTYV